jgi:uncharacterized iron-regulated membrane protein
MTKLILILVAVVAVIWIVRRALAGPGAPAKPPPEAGEQKGELVACAQCGVNLPQTEAYAASGVLPGAGGRFYCSEEHWRLGPRDS